MLAPAFRFAGSVVLFIDPKNIRSQHATEKIGRLRHPSIPDEDGNERFVQRFAAPPCGARIDRSGVGTGGPRRLTFPSATLLSAADGCDRLRTAMVSAADALERLRDGNRRFVAGTGRRDPHPSPSLEGGGAKEQRPFAIVLACSDSRVPVELVFDQGFGDLFVVRVAGNIAAPSQVGSIEFAAENFGTRLVVVMGHTGCGAVKATLGEIDQPSGDLSAGLRAIVDRIRPAVEGLTGSGVEPDASDIVARAVRANVAASADQLRRESPALERLLRSDGLRIVGAEYALETGVVEFLPESD